VARPGRDGGAGRLRGAEQVVARLKELEAVGVERVMLQHLLHDDLEAVELTGREVIPEVS
jgi:hypothetical protein